jgi:hypothetical protein
MNSLLQQILNLEQDECLMNVMVSSWKHEKTTNLKKRIFKKCFFIMWKIKKVSKWIMCKRCTLMRGKNIFNYMLKLPFHVPFQWPRVWHHEKVELHVALCYQSSKPLSNVCNILHATSSNSKSMHNIFLTIEKGNNSL